MKFLIPFIVILLAGCSSFNKGNGSNSLTVSVLSDELDITEHPVTLQAWALSPSNQKLGGLRVRAQDESIDEKQFAVSKVSRILLEISGPYVTEDGISRCRNELVFQTNDSNNYIVNLENANLEKGRCRAVLTDELGNELASRVNSLVEVEINFSTGVQFTL